MAKWRKKPVVVEADVYQPGMEDGFEYYDLGGQYLGCFDNTGANPRARKARPYINMPEGRHFISPGDYIITGIKGERYLYSPDIFSAIYEPADIDAGDSPEPEREARPSLSSQIDKLASFIMKNIPGEPCQSEGAVDTAIRLLKRAYVGDLGQKPKLEY